MEFIRDLFEFLMERKAYWLVPVLIVFILLAFLIIFGESTSVGYFIYTLF